MAKATNQWRPHDRHFNTPPALSTSFLGSGIGHGFWWLAALCSGGYCRWHTRLCALIVDNIDVIRCMILKDGKTVAAWYSHNLLYWVGMTVGWVGSRFNSFLATNMFLQFIHRVTNLIHALPVTRHLVKYGSEVAVIIYLGFQRVYPVFKLSIIITYRT